MLQIDLSAFPELETNRLLLRALRAADQDRLFDLRNDEAVNQFIDRPKSSSITAVTEFIAMIKKSIAENKSIYWVITEKGQDVLIGTICLWNIDPQHATAETGYELLPGFQGKGFMHEALARVLRFGFEEIKFKKIDAYFVPANERSRKLLTKLGFQETGISTDSKEIIYSLLPAQFTVDAP